jgi:hypothetical protein
MREGDLILEVDGRTVPDKSAYRKALSSTSGVSRLYVRRGPRALFFALRSDARKQAPGASADAK